MDFAKIIKFQQQYFTTLKETDYTSCFIENFHFGYVKKDFLYKLLNLFPKDFLLKDEGLYLNKKYNTFDKRSYFFEELSKVLHNLGQIKNRYEYMLVRASCGTHLFKIDRALIGKFGVKAEGIHINAYVLVNNEPYMWLSKRSNNIVEPNKYDNLVGGAVAFGYSVFETVIKEANEEAGIHRELAITSMFQGKVAYKVEKDENFRNDVVYMFNLQLPNNFSPNALDGEVDSFHLLSMEKVLELLHNLESFKFNSWLVAAYFLWHNYKKLEKKHANLLRDLFNKIEQV